MSSGLCYHPFMPTPPNDLLQRLRAARLIRVSLWRANRWRREVEIALARRFGLGSREERVFFLLILVVGVLAGFLGILVHLLISGLRNLLWGGGSLVASASWAPAWKLVGVPLLGGAVVGLIVWLSRSPVSGYGMSALVEAVVIRGGKLPPKPVLLRALAAIVTVGSGGALGREGPMIRLGAMISSLLGSSLRLPAHRVRILLGCGAAAGLSAAYNIPVGGALFAMEVVLGNFALETFGPIVISSVIATLIARYAEGDLPSFYEARQLVVHGGWEMLAFVGLGVVGALVAIAFSSALRSGTGFFDRLRLVPPPLRPVLGMGLLGVATWLTGLPDLLGSGTETIGRTLSQTFSFEMLVLLVGAKLLATVLTAGSGCAGGLFAPQLTVGALVGGAYGQAMQTFFPNSTSPYGVYAAVGMAAVLAGGGHAPISTILILFELTGNYDLILPLMIASILSSLLARQLYPYSMYTEPLQRQGVDVAWRMEQAALGGLKVSDLLQRDGAVLHPADNYRAVAEQFLNNRRQRLFVIGQDGMLLGAVSLHDIKHALDDPSALTAVVAHDLMRPVDLVLESTASLRRAIEAFAHTDFERLPVIEDGRLVGVVAKRDLMALYTQEVLGRPAMLATFVNRGDSAAKDVVELPPDFAVRLTAVPAELVGKTLAEADLPRRFGVRVLQVRRRFGNESQRVNPQAQTVLREDDGMILVGPTAMLETFERGELPSI